MTGLERFQDAFLKPELIARYWPDILSGVAVTLQIAVAVVATGLALGLVLAVVRSYRIRPVNALIVVFVDMFRALPPLVAILIVYFGLPNLGINMSGFAVLWLVLSLVLAAFAEEIFWSGIVSVRRGQWDAARSTGLSHWQTLVSVILPQAIRICVPPLTNRTIAVTKNTALGTVIGVGEIMNQGTSAMSLSGNATPLMMAAVAYVLIFVPVVALGSWIERRFALEEGLMDIFLHQFLNFDIMRQAWPIVFGGAQMTLLLCLAVIPLGLAGGLAVATGSISASRPLRMATKGYVDFFRAVPPLVLLLVIYSGLPFAGIRLSPFTAVCIAFLLNASSFYGEIFRAGIESVGRGQWEAARSTGLTWAQTYRFVVLPQASRNVLPDLVSNTVEVIKLTSIASVVSFTELLYAADMARSVTYNTSPIVLAAFLYLIVLWPVVRLVSRLEHRLGH